MVYAKFGGQTECIMGNWKIENRAHKTKISEAISTLISLWLELSSEKSVYKYLGQHKPNRAVYCNTFCGSV